MFMDLQAQQLTDALVGSGHPQRHHHSEGLHVDLYDPYKSPPDFALAKTHGNAKRVYRMASEKKLDLLEKEICPCCGLPENGELIPLKAPLSELYHLGSGYALYFKLLIYCITLLTMMFVISGFYNMISSAAADDCPANDDDTTVSTGKNNLCVQDFILKFSIANKKDDTGLLTGQMVLNLITVIAMGVFFQYMRFQLRKLHIDADDKTVTPSDYTIRITGLNPELSDQEIKEWIEGLNTEERPVKCIKIHRTFDVAEYVELRKKMDVLETLRVHSFQFERKNTITAEVKQTLSELERMRSSGLKPTDTVLITFDMAGQAAYVIEEYSKVRFDSWTDYLTAWFGTTSENFRGKDCYIERAPEPTDILWENLAFASWDRFKKRSLTKIFTLLIILASFGIIILINWGQGEALKKYGPKSHAVEALSGFGSILVVAINMVLSITVRILTEREKHPTYTSYFTAVAEKLCIAQFLNTALTTVLAQILLYNAFGSTDSFKLGLLAVPFYGKGGLIENMFYVFITNAFLTPILSYFDPLYLYKLYERRKAVNKGENTPMTQREAHNLFEEPELDLAVKNALLVKTMLLTAFFAPAVPFALIFAILGLILNYWVDKYLLLRRNIYPIALQNELCVNMIENIEWMGLMFGLGNILFILGLENSQGVSVYETVPKGLMYTILGIGFVLAMIPSEALNDKVFPIVDEVTEFNTYDGVRVEFNTDYTIQNPVTNHEGLHEQEELLARKKELRGLSKVTGQKKIDQDGSSTNDDTPIVESSGSNDNNPLLPKQKLSLMGLLGLGKAKNTSDTSGNTASTNYDNSPEQL
jgi:hypothetical protein